MGSPASSGAMVSSYRWLNPLSLAQPERLPALKNSYPSKISGIKFRKTCDRILVRKEGLVGSVCGVRFLTIESVCATHLIQEQKKPPAIGRTKNGSLEQYEFP